MAGLLPRLLHRAGNSWRAKARGGKPADTPIESIDFVVLDTELTGLRARIDSIISIGALWMTGPRIEMGSTYYQMVRPRAELTGESVVVHGITPTDAGLAPSITEVLPGFLEFCGNRVLVGHFLGLDLRFLNREVDRYLGHKLKNAAVDTLGLYEWIRGQESTAFEANNEEERNLVALAQRFGIEVSGVHNALGDAFMTAQLFQRLLAMGARHGLKSFGDLLTVSRPSG